MRLETVVQPVDWTRSEALVDIELPRAGAYALAALATRLAAVAQSGRRAVLYAPGSADACWELEAMLGAIARLPGLAPERVLVADLDERLLGVALDAGFWASVTLDARRGHTAEDVADLVEVYGVDGILLNVPRDEDFDAFCETMRRRGHAEAAIARLAHGNPTDFLGK